MRSAVAVCALVTATVSTSGMACDIGRWQPQIAEASRTYGIPGIWIRSVMQAESAGCTHRDGRSITSSAGAMGLMQLMPATWAELRRRHGFGADPHNPRDNVLAGAAYLRELVDAFGVPGAFAAYHAGPGRYEAHRRHGQPLPAQTRRYLVQVSVAVGIPDTLGKADLAAVSSVDPLFAINVRKRRGIQAHASSDARLFVRLRREAEDASPHSLEQSHVQD